LTALEFATSYGVAFHNHVLRATEDTLRAAYEIGREAVSRGLSLLDVAQVHHEALLSEIRRGAVSTERLTLAAGEFLLESLSAYEMVRRGFEEAREAAVVQRSRVEMLQELSNFLADNSLASDSTEPLKEVLQLVAEHACELTGAELCVVTLVAYGWSLQGSSYSIDESDRVTQLDAHHPLAIPSLDASERRLTVDLRSLDGKALGSIELFGGKGEPFGPLDEAILIHLSQMASATIERIHLHLTGAAGD
jgi:hypothetical protein